MPEQATYNIQQVTDTYEQMARSYHRLNRPYDVSYTGNDGVLYHPSEYNTIADRNEYPCLEDI